MGEAGQRGTARESRSTKGRKATAKPEVRDDHVPAMDPKVVDAALEVVSSGLVAAAQVAATEHNVPALIALHKHFHAIKSRGGSKHAGRTLPTREEQERFDHAFLEDQADPSP